MYPAITIQPARADALFGELAAAVLDDFGVTAVDETGDGALRAFFADAAGRDAALDAVRARFPDATIEAVDVSDENWAERSQAALKAVRVGGLTIAPPWDAASGTPVATTIIILPSMGFGTGHHATTRLCLAALQEASPAGKSVIDVGTGSGVLAIAAAKLGAGRVIGIDNDQDAIDNALENRVLNNAEVDFRCADLDDAASEGPFDLVLANLSGAVLIAHAADLQALAGAGGSLILSGLREEEDANVAAAFTCPVLRRAAEDGWIALTL